MEDYHKKRDFDMTNEPEGTEAMEYGGRFVVHEHHASHLHYDLRLEMEGVLKSWAIPKGPSMNPAQKRLAVMVEDHPLEYIGFRGEIAEGNYGAGKVEIWDSGTYQIKDNDFEKGKLVFEIAGTKLKGMFSLVRFKRDLKQWLLIKGHDDYADPNWKLKQVIHGGSRKDVKKGEDKNNSPPDDTSADPMPSTISPMLATLVDKPFSDPDWLFELKWDGYRAISFIGPDFFRFVSRKNLDLTERFPQSEIIPGLIDAQSAIIDGEIIAERNGKPDFQLLLNFEAQRHEGQLVYYAFDLLYLNGNNLRNRPLIERKDLLQSIIRPNDFMKFSDHIIEHGERLFELAAHQGIEGIMAKRVLSPYLEKRSSYWLKIKLVHRQEVVIAGYTKPRKSRPYFGALVIGVYENNALKFAGHVGGGFDDAALRQVFQLMQPLITKDCPFANRPKTNEPVTWIKPELVCEVKFAQWTKDDILRQPVFLGMRMDKPASEVVRENAMESPTMVKQKTQQRSKRAIPVKHALGEQRKGDVLVDVDGIEVPLTNLDKIYWPDEGYTKGNLLHYYYQIRETILPHLKDRPLILKRYPNGISGDWFYQHNLENAPDFVKTFPMTEEGERVNYAVINDTASLLYIVNLGCITQNPFSSRIQTLERPNWIVIDLDPEQASFETVCEVALGVKSVLDEAGLASYPKTSGARGMHIYIPIDDIYTYEQAEGVAQIVAGIVASQRPEIATIERMKKERSASQVYLDYQQNMLGKSMASVYSVREWPGATVSTPLTWDEVESKPDMRQFTMATMPEHLDRIGDIFYDVLTNRQHLAEPLKRLEKMLAKVNKRGGR